MGAMDVFAYLGMAAIGIGSALTGNSLRDVIGRFLYGVGIVLAVVGYIIGFLKNTV